MDIRSLQESGALSNPVSAGSKPQTGETGFLENLKESMSLVNEAQLRADQAVVDFEAGKSQNIHETMIALQKADLSFQLMMQVRNKILSAYDEVSKMQI